MSKIEEKIIADLLKSGLVPKDIRAHAIDDTERTACVLKPSVEGYAIPYFDIRGKRLPFYRVRLFDHEIKYKQVKHSINHIYFPPTFLETLKKSKHRTIIITEGEKKALAVNKLGYPAVAVSGVDSWKNRSVILPQDTEFMRMTMQKQVIKATLPASSMTEEYNITTYANGFEELIDLALSNRCSFMIIYDSDSLLGVKPQVQRAAATLGFELRAFGFEMRNIRQMILPMLGDSENMSLDDFLVHKEGGPEVFGKLFKQVRSQASAFPRHPNIRNYVNKKMQRSRLSRKDVQALSLAIIAELDGTGYRMHSFGENQMYYFDDQESKLMQVNLNQDTRASLQETSFGKLLYKRYGISPAADLRLMQWLGAQFSAEEPIGDVDPHRIVARPKGNEDCVRFQISDGNYVNITADEIEIVKNGSNGILFEANRTKPVDIKLLKLALDEQKKQPLSMWWDEVLGRTRIKERGHHQTLLALLYYISPFLYRWRGTQLPVELVIGESGSGKSTLCELRLSIQTGEAELKNAPTDIKDWHAALSNSGGLHVTDNVQLLNKALRTTLSDEICRLITEPQPHVEMRKLYSNAELMRIKVDNVFCFTAIAQPFMAADLLQRAIIVEFDKSQDAELSYDSSWKDRQLETYGGREAWLAHHFIVLQKFFQAVREHWDTGYKAQHRLINFEQILMILAKHVFGLQNDWIPEKLAGDVTEIVAANDWALQGLVAFATEFSKSVNPRRSFTAKTIVKWAEDNDEYKDCQLLVNTRKLGIYISNSKHMIQKIAGIKVEGKKANRTTFILDLDSELFT